MDEAVTAPGEGRTKVVQIHGCWGIAVGPFDLNDGGVMWAEVVPAPPRNWRPLPGRMARWWYEVHSQDPKDETPTTWAYTSGGSWSFRKTVRQAVDATYKLAYEEDADHD